MTTPEAHPVANLFPMMAPTEYAQLKEDIGKHGLREPVWLHRDGRIIDGRNRWKACAELGDQPPTRTYQGDDRDLVEFVVSLNLHRRHLNESQRAMVAARIANMRQGERTDREPSENFPKVSQGEAGERLQVSDKSVRFAKRVQDHAVPELTARVEAGELAVSTAAVIAEAPPERQHQIIAEATDRRHIVEAAKTIKAEKAAGGIAPARPEPVWSGDELAQRALLEAGQTIVVTLRGAHANLVRWAQDNDLYVRVDRRSEWGNPFEMPADGDRATVIDNYATHYLPHKPSLLARLPELRGKALGCWCAPEPCHGDILARQAAAATQQEIDRC